ncbi:unnamed protein product [Chironomus riparius]|uniref:Uncharacterized protein n=1 Tax=Chironomus riparius TaxID=315576 RepID=A0A9P0IXL7_9DIPT|nr:unnamed protein product [Chironomus riparius]
MESLNRSKDYDNVSEDISLQSYFQIGRMHGIKYLTSHKTHEKIFWGLAIITSLIFMVYFLFINQNQSTIVEISEKLPLFQIPFPAVTICPETKAKKSIVNVTDAYHNIIYNLTEYQYDQEYLSYIEALTQVCDPHLFSSVNVKNDSPTQGKEFLQILREIAVPKNEMILFCKFRNEIIDCADMFTESITDDGICYTFNMMHYEDLYRKFNHDPKDQVEWNLEKGYCSSDLDVCPKRALPGADYGLNVVLNMKTSDLDFMCKGPVQGFKIHVHPSDEHPQMMNGFFRVALNSDVVVAIQPEMSTDEINVNKKCHTSATKSLDFFNGYSQKNCLTECFSKFVFNKCGCIKYSMVHKNETKVCSQQDTRCVIQTMNTFFITERFKSEFLCDCMPSCKNLNYKVDTSSADFDYKRVFKAYNAPLDDEFPKSVMSRIHLFFTDDHFINKILRHKEKEDMTMSEKISQIGGLMAFFIGASVLSIIEILYFILKKVLRI